MKYKLIAAAILAAGLSNVVNATVITPTDPAANGNLGGSELVFTMFDGTNTFSLDLGVTMGSYAAPAANIGALNINVASDPLASMFFTSGVLNSNVQWGVMAADAVSAAPVNAIDTLGMRMLTTSTAATWNYNNAQTTASASALDQFMIYLNQLSGNAVTNGSNLSTSVADAVSWANNTNGWTSNNSFSATTTGPGSLLLVQVAQSYVANGTRFTSATTAAPTFSTVGQFSLAANGQLSTVPVPAAVWLFGSALAGLVGVARRRKVTV